MIVESNFAKVLQEDLKEAWEEAYKQKAQRDNVGKPELSYWMKFPRAAEALASVMEYGASKYARGNYALGGKPDEEYLDAFSRHFMQMMRYYHTGDETDLYDEESGCLHLGHMLFNLFMWIDFNHKELQIKKEQ